MSNKPITDEAIFAELAQLKHLIEIHKAYIEAKRRTLIVLHEAVLLIAQDDTILKGTE